VRSLTKKLLVLVVASALSIAALEVGAPYVYARYKQRRFDRAEISARLFGGPVAPSVSARPTAMIDDPRVADQPVIVHPYFGYVANPGKIPNVNQYGFFGPLPFAIRAPDVALIAVFGGSVAGQLVKVGGDVLRDQLAAEGGFRGRRIEVIDLALGGYKQPQQLLVLATLLALGAQFDVVVNLDGFNEIDGSKDNLQDGVNPFFPYSWNLHARQALDSDAAVHVANADAIRSRRDALRAWFARWPVAHSVFLLTLWDVLDQRQEAALRAETAALREVAAGKSLTLQQSGPRVGFADDESMYVEYAEVWARSSIEMSLLCGGFGIRYFHFLQPNQYLPGSKTLTDEERAAAYDPDVADTRRVETAYPLLSARGRELRAQGVAFTDLTMLFRDESRSVYSDTCCHLNRLGNELMATEIARTVGQQRDSGDD
jgi:hypothetical protein